MCGRFNVIDSDEVMTLLHHLGITLYPEFRFTPDAAPGSTISIVRQMDDERRVSDATWWLMLDPVTLKPNYKYASFNSRSDKLDTPRALAYKPYRESRCVIPASAFIEGLGDGKTYHKLRPVSDAIAFGGVYREWVNHDTGETALSASIITLPPPDNGVWAQTIHPKSMPLILPDDQATLDAWLDPAEQDVSRFNELLQPRIRLKLVATPIGKVSKWNEIGPDTEIPGDSD
ncbi:MAG: SOS response-associated peptidase family protein [Pseudohongiella sp.]|uniref:SOS response-associated peptidase n=1 Tax=Pseudohongiella sp. TaxID=1979412 RepID=UPI0034A00FC4